MYAIFLSDNKYVAGYLDLTQEHDEIILPHIISKDLPYEYLNKPHGFVCTYENGKFGLEKLPEQPKSETELLKREVAELWYAVMMGGAS